LDDETKWGATAMNHQPVVTAHVTAEGATIIVDGETTKITAGNEEDLRREVLRRTIELAVHVQRDVLLIATDSDGTWQLSVTPDGAITESPAQVSEPDVMPEPEVKLELQPTNGTLIVDPLPATGSETAQDYSDSVMARSEPSSDHRPIPTLANLHATKPPPPIGPARQGWQGTMRRATLGAISPRPGKRELLYRDAISSVTRGLAGPRTIVVINPKGGAHKTTAAMLIASTFGIHRGGSTLAWDNNETRGTLAWRAQQSMHSNTAVNLLQDLDRFSDPRSSRVGDLDKYVRSQAEAQFDVLASDEDAVASSMIDDVGFNRLHSTLQRFYRVIVVDTGNNMRASNWEAAIAAADQLVIVSAIREDTAGGAAWMVEGLAGKGHEDKLRSAVTVLSSPEKSPDLRLRRRLHDHFGSLTRAVVEVPHDPSLVSGGTIVIDALSPATRNAWLYATAKIAEGL
jgi:MinD-like ATPase involved in chromosome partitioning or flagellar assembly